MDARAPEPSPPSQAVIWGCLNARCGYSVAPSTLPTHYQRCPLCGTGRWGVRPNPSALDGKKQTAAKE